MKIEIELENEAEAEEILVALSNRAHQKGVKTSSRRHEIEGLGARLSRIFERQFNWDPNVFERHHSRRVTVLVKEDR